MAFRLIPVPFPPPSIVFLFLLQFTFFVCKVFQLKLVRIIFFSLSPYFLYVNSSGGWMQHGRKMRLWWYRSISFVILSLDICYNWLLILLISIFTAYYAQNEKCCQLRFTLFFSVKAFSLSRHSFCLSRVPFTSDLIPLIKRKKKKSVRIYSWDDLYSCW